MSISTGRTARERAAIRRVMGDPAMTRLTDDRPPVVTARQRSYASAWRPATTLPGDHVGDLFAATIGPQRGAVLPLHNERTVNVTSDPSGNLTVMHERAAGHGPDRGLRVVTLTPARDVIGLPLPGTWSVAGVSFLATPEPITSRGSNHAGPRWRVRSDPSSPRVTGIY